MLKKIIAISLLLIVGFMAISSASAILGIGEGDLVEVISVGIYDDYSGGSFGGAVDSSIAAKEDEAELEANSNNEPTVEQWGEFEVVTDYNSKNQAELDMVSTSDKNTEKSSQNYDIKLGMIVNITAKETIDDINKFTLSNVEITYQDGSVQKIENISYTAGGDLNKDQNFSIPFQFKLDKNLWNESIKLKDFYGNAHVKGDIYINTDAEADKLIGHIDNDVTETG